MKAAAVPWPEMTRKVIARATVTSTMISPLTGATFVRRKRQITNQPTQRPTAKGHVVDAMPLREMPWRWEERPIPTNNITNRRSRTGARNFMVLNGRGDEPLVVAAARRNPDHLDALGAGTYPPRYGSRCAIFPARATVGRRSVSGRSVLFGFATRRRRRATVQEGVFFAIIEVLDLFNWTQRGERLHYPQCRSLPAFEYRPPLRRTRRSPPSHCRDSRCPNTGSWGPCVIDLNSH